MLLPRRNTSAFTLLELIVVIVVLGVLAAIAVPTFQSVIDRSHDRTTEASLAALGREAAALAAFRGDGTITGADLEAADEDFTGLAAAAGVSAAAVTEVRAFDGTDATRASRSAEKVVVSFAVAADGSLAGIAAISPSGNCVAVQVLPSGSTARTDVVSCDGEAALGGKPAAPAVEDSTGTTSGDTTASEPVALVSPASASATVSGLVATVSWASVAEAESYRVQEGRFGAVKVVTAPATTASFDLPAGYTTLFSITAVRGNEISTPPIESNQVTSQPAAPSAISASYNSTDKSVNVGWTESTGATLYELVRTSTNLSSGAVSTAIVQTSAARTFSEAVPAGYSYSYSVKAGNDAGWSASTAQSDSVQSTQVTDTAGAAGTNLLANGGFESGSTGWSVRNPGGSVNFVVYERTDAFEGTRLAATNSNISGGSFYTNVSTTTVVGGVYCVAARVTTQSTSGGGGGSLALWNGEGLEAASASFSNLPGTPNWLRASACFTATKSASFVRPEIYPDMAGVTIFVDDVRVWRKS